MYRLSYEPAFSSGIGLRGDSRTCIYDDGTTLSMDAGPCQDVLDSGAYLVDDVTESGGGIIRVTPDTSPFLTYLALGVGALMLLGGGRVSRR